MKKIVLGCLILFCSYQVQAQDEMRKFRFGLKGSSSINWFTPADKKVGSDGSVVRFGYGATMEFGLTKNASLVTGVEVVQAGGKIEFVDPAYTSDKGIGWSEITTTDTATILKLTNRSYNLQYVEVPILLKMKTNEIGYLTYFGQFGLTPGFLTKGLANDNGQYLTGSAANIDKMNVSKDVQFAKVGLNIGGGVEYGLAGTTSIVFGVSYINGFTNILKKNSTMVRTDYVPSASVPFSTSIRQKGVVISVGVLF